jgi:ATP synthase protein I
LSAPYLKSGFSDIRMAARDEKSGGTEGAASDVDLARRLDRLSRELDAERRDRATAEEPPHTGSSDFAWAFRLASEFVAGILVGIALGWGLDRLAGTSPWGLIGFLLLGFAAGVLNVVRTSSRMTSGASGGKDGRPG